MTAESQLPSVGAEKQNQNAYRREQMKGKLWTCILWEWKKGISMYGYMNATNFEIHEN
jgi:DNA-binding PadR family transcriptional regulator